MVDINKNTYFIDIDGTVLFHHGSIGAILQNKPRALPGAVEKLRELRYNGHMVILTTARDEGLRQITEGHLRDCQIPYDMLICGITKGLRIIVNDSKPSMPGADTAIAITVERNEGIRCVNLA
jgi:uncharacterized HAD superfamily protein